MTEADGVHISTEEMAEAMDPSIGTGTPETAPFEEQEAEGEAEFLPEADSKVELADGAADDDDAIDHPEIEDE